MLAGYFAAIWREWRWREGRWQQWRAQQRRDRQRHIEREAERDRLALIDDVEALVRCGIVTDAETAMELLEMPEL
jgi:hypothetical protein